MRFDDDLPVAVVVLRPLDGPFTYLSAAGDLPPGTIVRVPFGAAEIYGVVWNAPAPASGRLKPIGEVVALPPLTPALLDFVDRVSAETLAPRGAVLKLVLSVPQALEPGPFRQVLRWAGAPSAVQSTSPALAPQTALQTALSANGPMTASRLAKAARVSAGQVKDAIAKGLIEPICVDADEPGSDGQRFDPQPARLSDEQRSAARALAQQLADGRSDLALLAGVPGSGKTEVYFELIRQALDQQGRVLVLLPEVVLGTQWLDRFAARFGGAPLHWHSAMTPAQRRRAWRLVSRGESRVVVGPRSALFLPFPSLSLIVIDEEHDPSFKQEDGVIYDARRAAIAKAASERAKLLLCSATPSLDALTWVDDRGVPVIRLAARHGAAKAARIELIDLRQQPPAKGDFLSAPLAQAIAQNFQAGSQSLLYLNRRGFAPLVVCRACGHRFVCPNCTAWLASHAYRKRLLCHHCGYSLPPPSHCPDCGALDQLVNAGPGVERIADEAQRLVPDARIAIMSSETTASARASAELVEAMVEHRIDILVGTQLATKGHHFPALTLVGVVDADMALDGSDLRASERCFQILHQLAGRAGREATRGTVYLQTRSPDHPILKAIIDGDHEKFAATELTERAAARMPPYSRLAAMIFSGPDSQQVHRSAKALLERLPQTDGIRVFGPAPAPIAMLRGRYRVRLLVRADPGLDLPTWLGGRLDGYKPASNVRLAVDLDPQSFF